tara:strand:- start:3162 stop:3365 length:204 start_codon:yes stop_codon:yes gene_type:complete
MEIKIPKELAKKLEQRIKQTDFKSIQEYIIYTLEQIVSDQDNLSNRESYSPEEEEALKKNLKDMGYL